MPSGFVIKLLSFLSLLLLTTVAGRQLNFRDTASYFIHGATVGYRVDVERCDRNLPPQMQMYSFGDVIDNARVYYSNDDDWWIHFTTRRFVNGSDHNTDGPVSRLIEAFFTNAGEVDFTVSDSNGETGDLLVSGNINCKTSRRAITMTTQTEKGKEMTSVAGITSALQNGENVRYHVNMLQCGPFPQRFTGTVGWAGRISGHRVNGEGHVKFTQTVELPTATFVLDVTIYPSNDVIIYVDSLVPVTRRSSGVLRKECVLGSNRSFHIYKV